ncbi:MAG: integration host factor subunit alpha [Lentisphaerae bacterium]|nr:integration host factor subunit alpha [Lentisphaerota bacterium]
MLQRNKIRQTTLTKADIVDLIHEYFIEQNDQFEEPITIKDAFKVVETLIEIIKGTLESGEEVLITGFGKFYVRDKSERRGRNPATGEEMILKARRVVTFSPSQKLRDLVNK